MHSTAGHQWLVILLLTVMMTIMCYQEVSAARSQARVTRSPIESLQDHGTYIIQFKNHVTEEEQQQFATMLTRESTEKKNFTVGIIENLFIVKCLTARLSASALNWVRTVCICELAITAYKFFLMIIINLVVNN